MDLGPRPLVLRLMLGGDSRLSITPNSPPPREPFARASPTVSRMRATREDPRGLTLPDVERFAHGDGCASERRHARRPKRCRQAVARLRSTVRRVDSDVGYESARIEGDPRMSTTSRIARRSARRDGVLSQHGQTPCAPLEASVGATSVVGARSDAGQLGARVSRR